MAQLDIVNAELTPSIDELATLDAQTPSGRDAWAGLGAALQGQLDGSRHLSPDMRLEYLLRDGVHSNAVQGFAFEYTVHAAVRMGHPGVAPLVAEAINGMGYGGGLLQSLLFIPDRTGPFLLDSALLRRAEGARVITGGVGRPPSLNDALLDALRQAAHRSGDSNQLPASAPDLWRADLFLSGDDGLRWIATDVKSSPKSITPRRGLPLVVTAGRESSVEPLDGRTIVTLPLSGRGYGIWEDGVRRLEQAKYLLQDRGRFARLVGAVDKPAVRWLLKARDQPIQAVIEHAWNQAGVSDPMLRGRAAVHDAELLVPRRRGPEIPQTLRLAV